MNPALCEHVDSIATQMLGELPLLFSWNCGHFRKESSIVPQSKYENPLTALLELMIYATPPADLASAIHPSRQVPRQDVADSGTPSPQCQRTC